MYRRKAAIRLSVNFPWMSLRRCHINMENHRCCRAWAMWLQPLQWFGRGRTGHGRLVQLVRKQRNMAGADLSGWALRCLSCVTESRTGVIRVGVVQKVLRV